MTSARTPPRAYIVEEALDRLTQAAEQASPYETGGLLVGARTSDGVWITLFLELTTARRSKTRYRIPSGMTHQAIDGARRQDARVGYLGDWHTHPADAGPSDLDIASLRGYVGDAAGEQRLLGLVRRATDGWQLALLGLPDQNSDPQPILFEVTGPLPAADQGEVAD